MDDQRVKITQTDAQIDAFVADIVKQLHARIDIPAKERAWHRIAELLAQQSVQRNRRRHIVFSAITVVATALFFLIIAALPLGDEQIMNEQLIVQSPQLNKQNGSLIEDGQSTQNGLLTRNDFFPDNGLHAKQQSKLSEAMGSRQHHLKVTTFSIEDARHHVEFSIYVPKYIPAAFTFSQLKAYEDSDHVYRNVQLEYVNEIGQRLNVVERKLTGHSIAIPLQDEPWHEVKEISINGHKGVLKVYAKGGSRIDWRANNVMFTVMGEVREEEIIRFASSLHKS